MRGPHPKAAPHIDIEVERALRLLRATIHRQRYTQLQVQNQLGWGRTYISQLLRRQKSLRFDQILQILDVIEVEPVEFFGRLYSIDLDTAQGAPQEIAAQRTACQRSQHLLQILIDQLTLSGTLGRSELTALRQAADGILPKSPE